ncbi:tannase/feruloyl esterase family alpha/beta hydrolase [Emcibacter sp.]|uniref:tannase/feruloyl esterase family alpha/beta hydrolase n=1 Tax=Emcibacter sp. TaxID=1979954 RepID=UPI002AA77F1D|nr:tannase/feruloyl esterase family alpha/beta hydrolase [Emcibacter sp.]
MTEDERDWTPETFDPDRDIPELESRLGDSLSAWKTDLSSFRARGGKLITYHGWTDPWLSPYNSVDYYQQVAETMGPEKVDDFFRLFMVPGMDHCRGGPGPDRFDMVDAIMKWTEEGIAPDRIIALGALDNGGQRTRPLCPYPQVAVYRGEGDTDQAENFECRAAE